MCFSLGLEMKGVTSFKDHLRSLPFCKTIEIDEARCWQGCSSKRKLQSCLFSWSPETKFYPINSKLCTDRDLERQASCTCLALEARFLPRYWWTLKTSLLAYCRNSLVRSHWCYKLWILPQVGAMGVAGCAKSRVYSLVLRHRGILESVCLRQSVSWITIMSVCPKQQSQRPPKQPQNTNGYWKDLSVF